MIISEQEIKRRLEHQKNLGKRLAPLKERDRRNVTMNEKGQIMSTGMNLSMPARTFIGALAHTMPGEKVAKIVDIHPRTVDNLKFGRVDGKVNSDSPQNKILQDAISKTLLKAKATSADIVMLALGLVKESDIVDLGVKDKMVVAEKAAVIVEKLTPKENSAPVQNNQIIFYAPKQKEESDLETITIRSLER